MLVYFTTYILLLTTVFINFRQKDLLKKLVGIILIMIAVYSSRYSKDLGNYIGMYNEATNGIMRHEVSFYLLANMVRFVFNNMVPIFIFYAIIGVTVKLSAISKLTEFVYPTLLIYFSYYFILHEVTQIRAGVASAFVLMSITSLKEENRKSFFLYAFLAALFHYSAIVILPLYFIRTDRIGPLYYYLIPIGLLIWILNINLSSLVSLIDIEYVRVKYQTYLQLKSVDKIHLINLLSISRLIFCYILLWKWRILSERSKYSVILIKMYISSIFVFIIFSDIPAMAFRLSEMLGIVEIILIPFLFYIIKGKDLTKVILSVIGFGFLGLILFYEKLLAF